MLFCFIKGGLQLQTLVYSVSPTWKFASCFSSYVMTLRYYYVDNFKRNLRLQVIISTLYNLVITPKEKKQSYCWSCRFSQLTITVAM